MFFFAVSTSRASSSNAGRHDDLGEDVGHGAGHLDGDRPVRRDDAAEGRDRVALVRLAVRLRDVVAHGDAARVGVLDDGDGRLVAVVVGGAHRGVGVDVVVVGHLLAVQLPGLRQARLRLEPVGVEGGVLVRVLAVAEHGRPVPRRPDPRREAGAVAAVGVGVAHPRRHVHVVGRGVHEGLGRERACAARG